MSDIARAAKVHPSTVSLALRNDPRLPTATRERIQALAKAKGYRPNPMVSALIAERRKGKPQKYKSTLAFLTNYEKPEGWKFSPNYAELYESLQHYADIRGYRLEEFWLKAPGMTSERLQKILISRGIHGIVVAPLSGKQHTLDFDFSYFAAIALGQTLRTPQLDHVTIGYFDIVSIAMKQLRALKHRNIGFVSTQHIDRRVNHHSKASYLVECQKIPISHPLLLIDENLNQETLWNWYQKHLPDALILASRNEFTIAQSMFREHDIGIPESVALVNLDILKGSQESGIIQNLDQEAAITIDLLTSRTERAQFGIPEFAQTISVTGLWQDGWSTCKK